MFPLSPLQQIYSATFVKAGVNVFIKRDDLIHPIISGNKYRKLKYNLITAKQQGYQGVLSFGGAYSNHIHALAYACREANLKSFGIIRGESHYRENATLKQARDWHMALKFVDRKTYRQRTETDFLHAIQQQYPSYFIIPEGGSNHLALKGVAECAQEIATQQACDYLLTPVGSAGTISGLILGANKNTQTIGVSVLKQSEYLIQEIEKFTYHSTRQKKPWQLLSQYHDGGYGKFSKFSEDKIVEFIKQTQIPFEPIYSGKMVIAFLDLLEKGYFDKGSNIVLLHTGGLQGLNGLIERGKITANQWLLPSE